MLDCVIIGTGAAGVSAALTLKAKNKSFILLGNPELSKKIRCAEKIKNYPGLASISGGQLQAAFLGQLSSENIDVTPAKVNGVYPCEGGYTVMCGDKTFETRTVILATGVEAVKPVEGEEQFLGRGLSYCAVCDGFLYKDKVIAVFLEDAEQLDELELLATYARTIHLFTKIKGIEKLPENVVLAGEKIIGVTGDMRVKKVVHASGETEVDGVFMLKQSVSAANLVHGIKVVNGAVPVDRNCATNLDGVFAAGDVTGRPYQYAKAVGEGNVAAHSACEYLKK